MGDAVMGGKGKSLLIFFYPRIAKMFPNWSGWNNLLKILKPRQTLFRQTIEDHAKTLQDGHARDFVDIFLQEIQNTDDPNSIFHHSTGGWQ